MKSRSPGRVTRGALVVAGAAVALLTAVAPAMATADAKMFTGGARGLTAESAIAGAIDDAKNSASGEGLFDCEVVGEPQLWEVFDDPIFGHVFYAQADVSCE